MAGTQVDSNRVAVFDRRLGRRPKQGLECSVASVGGLGCDDNTSAEDAVSTAAITSYTATNPPSMNGSDIACCSPCDAARRPVESIDSQQSLVGDAERIRCDVLDRSGLFGAHGNDACDGPAAVQQSLCRSGPFKSSRSDFSSSMSSHNTITLSLYICPTALRRRIIVHRVTQARLHLSTKDRAPRHPSQRDSSPCQGLSRGKVAALPLTGKWEVCAGHSEARGYDR